VFDGPRSTLRVDGLHEAGRALHHNHNDDDDDELIDVDQTVRSIKDSLLQSSSSSPSTRTRLGDNSSVGGGLLDGLTIGSDHRFDMSLCDGGGEEGHGDGEGAIAEVLVFKGGYGEWVGDVERRVMRRQGISMVRDEGDVRSEVMYRKGEMLLREAPSAVPANETKEAVPLRYVANNKRVNWERKHRVTGADVYQNRIGSKNAGDSDW